MPTNIDIDEKLLAEARALGHFRTKRATVNEALAEFVRLRKQRRIADLFGKIEMEPSYDYKAGRSRA